MDIDPAKPEQAVDEEEAARPPDESTMMGVAGVQAEVEAQSARAEAELEGEAPPLGAEDAEV
jgi:hypothetical protein